MQDVRQLDVWKRAHQLVLATYRASAKLPQSESFGLQLNLRRSSLNVARSIAEGAGRSSDTEFLADLRKASAAASELDYLLLVCRDLGFLTEDVHGQLAGEAEDDLGAGSEVELTAVSSIAVRCQFCLELTAVSCSADS